MAIYKIKVAKVEEITKRNGSKFNAYKTVDKNGNLIHRDVNSKFLQDMPQCS